MQTAFLAQRKVVWTVLCSLSEISRGKEKGEKVMDHNYALETAVVNRGTDLAPTTPSKTTSEKRAKSTESSESDDISLKNIMKMILTLEKKVDSVVTHQGIKEEG